MHELPVTQSVLAIVLEAAELNGGGCITTIDLAIGEFSSIVDDSVQFYFDILSKDTPAEGAKLNFKRELASVTCFDCGHEFKSKAPLLPLCPVCDGIRLQVVGGQKFYVESIEVEYENPCYERHLER